MHCIGNKANLVTENHDFKDEQRIYRKHKRKKKVIQKMKKKTKLKSVMNLHSGLEKLVYSVKKEKWKCKVRLR